MAENMEMQVMDTSSDPITGTPEQNPQPMSDDTMPRFDTLGQDRQLQLLNLFPNMERNAILGLMESGMSFEDAIEQIGRMFQNPPPELRKNEMDMMKRFENVGMNMLGGAMSDKDAQVLRDAKDPQTGMPIRKFDFMNKSGALGAFGGEMPMQRGMTPEMREEMIRNRNRKNM